MVEALLLVLRVVATADDDAADLEDFAYRLSDELLEQDFDVVSPVVEEKLPERGKGLGTLAGLLAVGVATVKGMRKVIGLVRDWATRNSRTVELRIGSDSLILTGVTSEQQDKLIDAWIARHGTGT